jgi:chromate transport protein ChrA
MPAALALIVVAALKLVKDVFRPSSKSVMAGAAFAFALFLHHNPALLLLAGGVIGALVLKDIEAKKERGEKQEKGAGT